MKAFELIEKLVVLHGPSGDEQAVAQVLAELAKPFADEVRTDVLGSLIVRKKGKGPKILFAAHMDTVGVVATHIEKNGAVRLGRLGAVTPQDLLHARVRFQNGTVGTVRADAVAEGKALKVDDLFLEVGAADAAQAEKLVRVGDTAVYADGAFRAGDRVCAPSLESRAACAALLLALEKLDRTDNDLYFVFTAQGQVGARGAKTAAFDVAPDYAVVLDGAAADDMPGGKKTLALGKGAAIKIMDGAVLCHPRMVENLNTLAKKEKLAHQSAVGGTGAGDAGPIHQTRLGVCTGSVCIPCRYPHSPDEWADIKDVESCAALVAAFAHSKF